MASEAARAAEAILMVADEPVEPQLLAQLLELSPARVDELCGELAAAYQADDRGFIVARVAGGYRFQSHPDLAPYVERFVLDSLADLPPLADFVPPPEVVETLERGLGIEPAPDGSA